MRNASDFRECAKYFYSVRRYSRSEAVDVAPPLETFGLTDRVRPRLDASLHGTMGLTTNVAVRPRLFGSFLLPTEK